MKKALIVGGSNGIGLAIANKLMLNGYYVIIADKKEPDILLNDNNSYTYYFCDLLDFDDKFFEDLSNDESIDVLMITAGFGRVANFEFIHQAEISNMFQVNAASCIKILSYFYKRIKSSEKFYCGIMGSIAGFVSSPLFALYAATKASICRFIESVNIELEASGIKNRILNISPGSIKGTAFNGDKTDLKMLGNLTDEILERLYNSDELYIPEYDNIYKNVIERYKLDAHNYGMDSYSYKIRSGRIQNEKKVCIGYLSGTFDLFHIGHLNLLRNAKRLCDYLIVGVHPDASHKNKEAFIPFEERKEIVASCKYVDKVVDSCSEDSDAWSLYNYNKLFVGSDYKDTDRFSRYEEFFKNKNVEIIYLPYTKNTNSTQIRRAIAVSNFIEDK